MDQVLFSIGSVPFNLGNILAIIGIFLVFIAIYFFVDRYFLPFISKKENISKKKQRKVKTLLSLFLLFLFVDFFLRILDIKFILFNSISQSMLLEFLLIVLAIYIILWVTSNVLIHRFVAKSENKASEDFQLQAGFHSSAIKNLRWLLFCIVIIIVLRYIDWDPWFWRFDSPKEGDPNIFIRLSSIFTILIIFLLARISIWVINHLLLRRYFIRKNFDSGIIFSIHKLIEYFIYLIATILALSYLGMKIGLILGGAAALLVGIGLALQNTFADFFAGLVLLFERPVKVGDYVSFEGRPVIVQNIGLRTSKVKSRDNLNYFIPNSKLIVNSIINWSHDERYVRFEVKVGVSYGSDTRLVEEILLKAAEDHKDVLGRPKPKVIFNDFSDSSLVFILYYYSSNIYNSEWVKSDLRFAIDQLFRENNITIPFPQRDIWIRKTD